MTRKLNNIQERNQSPRAMIQSSKAAGNKPSVAKLFAYSICLLLAITSYSLSMLAESKTIDVTHVDDSASTVTRTIASSNTQDVHEEYETGLPKYDEEEALQYVYYSKISFCTEYAITSWSCGEMCDKVPIVSEDKVRYIPEGERFRVQGYVAQIPTKQAIVGNDLRPDDTLGDHSDSISDIKCVVSFRGSLNGANWYADLLAKLRPWPLDDLSNAEWCRGCKAHFGFTEAYDELRQDVYSAIEDLNCTGLVLTGHSLGAAVATIASFDLRSAMEYKVDATWTFGKPRIGNEEFVNSFVAAATEQGVSPPIWRVVHYRDPVPRLPPNFPLFHPVSHGALEIYYTDRASSEYIYCPQHGAAENQSKACMGGWPWYFSVNMDHVSYLNQSFAFKDFPDECKVSESPDETAQRSSLRQFH